MSDVTDRPRVLVAQERLRQQNLKKAKADCESMMNLGMIEGYDVRPTDDPTRFLVTVLKQIS